MRFIQKFVFFVFLVFGSVGQAEVYNVSTTAELREALASAANNDEDDTIYFADGTYKTTEDGEGEFAYLSEQVNSLTLVGSGHDRVFISGSDTDKIFNHATTVRTSLVIEGISFIDAVSQTNGGAIFTNGELEVSNARFHNNYSESNGGAIKNSGSTIIRDSIFTSNKADGEGGAMWVSGNVEIQSAALTRNVASKGGGAIYVHDANPLLIVDSEFEANEASLNGGGAWLRGRGIELINNTFTNNSGSRGGGFWTYSEFTMNSSLMIGNRAEYGGGGFATNWGGSTLFTVRNSVFRDNEVTTNEANYCGGGFTARGAVVENSIFYGNTAPYGGVLCAQFNVKFINSLAINNSSGIDVSSRQDFNLLANSVFLNNGEDFTREANGDSNKFVDLKNNYIDLDAVDSVYFESNTVFENVTLGFEDQENNDYRLTERSDLIDRGTVDLDGFEFQQTDLIGTSRVIGASIDIGPYEYDGEAPADGDDDGINDNIDNCPSVANEDQADFDSDGEGDVCDSDDDNDGTNDGDDAFPFDDTESLDTDGDGIGNNEDEDDDGDGFLDDSDPQPVIANVFAIDSDGDGVADSIDDYPTDATKQYSGSGDLDGDGYSNDEEVDYCSNPFDKNSQPDTGGLSTPMIHLLTEQ